MAGLRLEHPDQPLYSLPVAVIGHRSGFVERSAAGAAGLENSVVHIRKSRVGVARWPATLLDRIIVTPQVHRIHHSVDPSHYNRNFADALPLFDILFGTYYRPQAQEFAATGPARRSLHPGRFGRRSSVRCGP